MFEFCRAGLLGTVGRDTAAPARRAVFMVPFVPNGVRVSIFKLNEQ